MRGREEERERRQRALEKKAREQADQCEYLKVNCDKQHIFHTFQAFSFYSSFTCFSFHRSVLNLQMHAIFLAVVALEEQRANLNRELSILRHTHNKVTYSCLDSELVLLCHHM